MKTHTSHHDYQFKVLVLLVVVSILLLGFGIYKVIIFNQVTNSYTYSMGVTEIEPNTSVNLSEAMSSHLFTENIEEGPLAVEDWMVTHAGWNSESLTAALLIANETTYEEPLALEDWMTSTENWNVETVSISSEILNEHEPELQLQQWMLSDEGWIKGGEVATDEHEEEGLQIQSWMINTQEWNVPVVTNKQWALLNKIDEEALALEPWMVDCSRWVPEKYSEIEIYEFSYTLQEEVLELEAWMLDDSSWVIQDSYLVEDFPVV